MQDKLELTKDEIISCYSNLARSGNFPDNTYLHRTFKKLINDQLKKSPNSCILDAGGGAGYFGIDFARQGFRSVVLDISYNATAVAKERSIEQGCLDKVKEIVGDIENLPILDEQFDIIICIFVFSHIKDPYKAMGELYRVLKNRGQMIISFENKLWHVVANGISERYEDALNLLCSEVAFVKAYDILPPVRLYTKDEIEKICNANGLKIRKLLGVRHITSFQEYIKNIGTTDAERLMNNDQKAMKLEELLINSGELLCLARHFLAFCEKCFVI